MYMSSDEVRWAFLNYFQEQGHAIVPSSSLVPAGDPTLLFTNAGMVQFKDLFLGLEKRDYLRATTSQKCMRVSGKHNDFENVGPSPRHHTFFEMLGNFSFGDYFKKDAIRFAWDFLVNRLGLEPSRFWFTVFEGDNQVPADDEAARLWQEVGAPPERVLRFSRKDNFWQMGEAGPCGPNSEIHYYRGPNPEDPEYNRREYVNGEGEETIELWNLVFMQYDMQPDGSLVPLPKPSVDTGAGLERVAAVMQGKDSNYDTDLFVPIISRTRELLGRPPEDYLDQKRGVSYRVIADHARAVTFLIADGVSPSNEGRGYVTRLILRRAARHGQLLGFDGPFLDRVIPTVIDEMKEAYPEVRLQQDRILRVAREEEERFLQTLRVGSEILSDLVVDLKGRGETVIPGAQAFRLYDTFGFPLDLTREVARENEMTVDEASYRAALDEASERSRARRDKVDDATTRGGLKALEMLRAAGKLEGSGVRYDPYSTTELETGVVGIISGTDLVDSLSAGEKGGLVLAATPFYVESGGQISDTGRIVHEAIPGSAVLGWEFRVDDTRQPVPGLIVHIGEMIRGTARVEDAVLAKVDLERRLDTMRNHTATHLLHSQLRAVLGEHVQQAGSLVAPDRLRFDFTHNRPVKPSELEQIEEQVNRAILEDYPVRPQVMPYKEAIGKGAMALFTEKYGDTVRMLEIDGISRELCGGTHVAQTGEIGLFHIVGESSIGSGARRIEAVTGTRAYQEFHDAVRTVERIGEKLRSTPSQLESRIDEMITELDSQTKEIARLHRELAKRQADSSTPIQQVDGIKVVSRKVDVPTLELLREQVDLWRDRIGSGVIAVGTVMNDRPNMVVAVTPDLADKGYDARKIVGAAARKMGGGGGGKATLAQAGGKDADKLQEAFDFVLSVVKEMAGGQ